MMGLEDIELTAPYALLLGLAAIPVALAAWRPRRDAVVIAHAGGVAHLRPTVRVRALRWLPGVRVVAIVLLAVGAAGPRIGDARAIVPAEGIDIALAIDSSSSMTASRLGDKDRLEATKEVVREFIRGLENDRVGIVSFAETAISLSPPTLDYAALDQIVESLRTGLLPDGTAIGLGIAEAVNMLRDSPAARAGLKAGDVITSVNGRSVGEPRDVVRELRDAGQDESVELGVMRDRQTLTLKAQVEPRRPAARRYTRPA